MISTELTSISAGLHSGGSIGVGLRSGCSCLGEVFCLLHFDILVHVPIWGLRNSNFKSLCGAQGHRNSK